MATQPLLLLPRKRKPVFRTGAIFLKSFSNNGTKVQSENCGEIELVPQAG